MVSSYLPRSSRDDQASSKTRQKHVARGIRAPPRSGADSFLNSLNSLYWLGIDRDLDEILRTLSSSTWKDFTFSTTASTDGDESLGFEAFVNRATWQEDPDIMFVFVSYLR
jgi:hypothetical protein